MPTLFKQTFLKPGRFHIGGGRFRDYSAEQIRGYVEGTNRLLKAGHASPVLLEHAPLGSEEGAPKSPRDVRAERVKHGAGWLKSVAVGSDGSAAYEFEVTDPTVAQKIKDGSIKFTSPEFRPLWTDGKGQAFQNIISHVALTHQPRDVDQSALETAGETMQFSLAADWEPIQFSSETDDEPGDEKPEFEAEKPADEPAENPDLAPDKDSEASEQAQRESILSYLAELGVVLPSDTVSVEVEQFLDRLQTGLMTACETVRKAEEEEAAKDEEEDKPLVQEDAGDLQQFSLADAENGSIENKLLARIIKQEGAALTAKLDGMVRAGKLTPAAKDKLLSLDGAMQFSAEGDFLPAATVRQVVELLDDALPENQFLSDDQIAAQFSAADHPDSEWHKSPEHAGLVSPEEAKAIVEAHKKALPAGMYQ